MRFSLVLGSLWGGFVYVDFIRLNRFLSNQEAVLAWLALMAIYSAITFLFGTAIFPAIVLIKPKVKSLSLTFGRPEHFLLLFAVISLNLFLANLAHFWKSTSGSLFAGLPAMLSSFTEPVNIGRLVSILAVSLLFSLGVGYLRIKWQKFFTGRRGWLLFAGVLLTCLFFPHLIRSMHTEKTSLSGPGRRIDPQRKQPEIILVGLDGAEWKVINTLIGKGKLPNLENLVRNGSFAKLETLKPAYSPVVWTTIATGKLPDKHGITDFVSYQVPGISVPVLPRKEPYYTGGLVLFFRLAAQNGLIRKIPITALARKARTIWNICSICGLDNCMLGWWGTYPAEYTKGSIVSDFFYPSACDGPANDISNSPAGLTYPDSLYEILLPCVHTEKEVSYEVYSRFIIGTENDWELSRESAEKSGYNPEKALRYAYPEDLTMADIWTAIFRERKRPLSAVYLNGIDIVSHAAFKYFAEKNPPGAEKYGLMLEKYYAFTDSLVGEIFSSNPRAIKIVISDHGFQQEGAPGRYHHRYAPEGVFIISGPGIKTDNPLGRIHVTDILPTLCYILGIPVGRDMDGRVVDEIFRESSPQAHQISYTDSYEKFIIPGQTRKGYKKYRQRDGKEMMERLRAIGYVD